jgi:hypothetical protein
MALIHVQAALARLTTDPAARALLIGDPEAFATQAALSAEELATLREQAETSLHLFANSLLQKRLRESGRAMPLVSEALGAAYPKVFEAFAASSPVTRDPAHDALHFLRWLPRRQDSSQELRELARYEYAWLLMRRTDRRFQLGIFSLPGVGSRFFALWWRLRKRHPFRYFQWPRGGSAAAVRSA